MKLKQYPPGNLRSLAFLFLCRKEILNLKRNTKKENDIEHKMILSFGSSPPTLKKKKSYFHCCAPVITVNECFLSPDGWLVLTACCFSLAEWNGVLCHSDGI